MSWVLIGVASCALSGCGAGARQNRTFYDWADPAKDPSAFERSYPALDATQAAPHPGFSGVLVIREGVRLSRPRNWLLQNASNDEGDTYVQYVSPSAYSFAIYERPDSSRDSWDDILKRYEADLAAVKGRIVGQPVPIATARGQGRSYSIERDVEANPQPLLGRSLEMLVRGEQHVVLVQIVFQSEDLSDVDQELLRSVGTLEVL